MVAPKRAALAEANKRLDGANKKLTGIRAKVKELKDRVASLEDSLMKVSSLVECIFCRKCAAANSSSTDAIRGSNLPVLAGCMHIAC